MRIEIHDLVWIVNTRNFKPWVKLCLRTSQGSPLLEQYLLKSCFSPCLASSFSYHYMKSFRAVLKPESTSAERMDVGKSLKAADCPGDPNMAQEEWEAPVLYQTRVHNYILRQVCKGGIGMETFRENKCKSSLLMYPAGCFSAFLTSSERWQTPACDSVLPSWAT